jgi:two-component system sensor kinase FixL
MSSIAIPADGLESKRLKVLAATALLIGANAVLEWRLEHKLTLDVTYLFPILIVGYYLSRWKILLVAALCSVLREALSPGAWETDAAVRILLVLGAYFGAGLFVSELSRTRRLAMEQSRLRQEAEEQMRVLIESSPVAILDLDMRERVVLANEAAHRLLGYEPGALPGESIAEYLPALAAVPRSQGAKRFFRANMECTGRRRNGEVFLAQIWFSTYQTASGPRLAAMVRDASEELRDREDLAMHASLTTSRILVGAVSHEVRNLCAAARAAYINLGRHAELAEDRDYRALGTMVTGLEILASSELRLASDQPLAAIDLRTVLDELRIVIEPPFREAGVETFWEIDPALSPIQADHHHLLQVFLNLCQNSRRALRKCERRQLVVAASREQDWVRVRIRDSGRGVPEPEKLFQPFQPGAAAHGLGLYISRAMIRSFGGDLRYEPDDAGSCFVVQLAPAT